MHRPAVQPVEDSIPQDNIRLKRLAIVEVVLRHCKDVFCPLSSVAVGVQPPTLEIVQLSGGITNELFHVYDRECPSTAVVLRLFGIETDRVISRESELFYQSLFLKTFVHGKNFLVYEFLHNYSALPYRDMPVETEKIADSLAEFQVRATVAAKMDFGGPLYMSDQLRKYWGNFDQAFERVRARGTSKRHSSSESSMGRSLVSVTSEGAMAATTAQPARFSSHCRLHREENSLLHALDAWVAQVVSDEIINKVGPLKREEFVRVAASAQGEVQWMLEKLQQVDSHLTEGVCHNDVLCANVMRHSETGELKIIDFDYVRRNFLLYDVANHFNEYTGLECDYATHFPSDEQMARFIRVYRSYIRNHLLSVRRAAGADGVTGALGGLLGSGRYCLSCRDGDGASPDTALLSTPPVFDDEDSLFFSSVTVDPKTLSIVAVDVEGEEKTVQTWVGVVRLLTLASHLSWGIWSLLQEAVSTLDVDFLEYAKLRISRYMETKEEFSKSL